MTGDPLVGVLSYGREGPPGIEVMFGDRGPVWTLTEDGQLTQSSVPTVQLDDPGAEPQCDRDHCEDGDCPGLADEDDAITDLTNDVLRALSNARLGKRARTALALALDVHESEVGYQG